MLPWLAGRRGFRSASGSSGDVRAIASHAEAVARVKRHRRRLHGADDVAGHSEVWPAYVDVLSAAFVFILLAFLALMTRDAKSTEEREGGDKKVAKLAAEISKWQAEAGTLVYAVPDDYKRHLETEVLAGLAAREDLLKACVADLPGQASTTFDESKLDPDRRHAVTVVCTLRSDLISFVTGKWEPGYTPRDLQDALVRVARDLTTRECLPGPFPRWCATGFDVVGHADCRPVSVELHRNRKDDAGGPSLTNWELSTNRAGSVIRNMLALGTPTEVSLRPSFDVFAGGREARDAVDPSCECSVTAPCHDQNRRVVIRIKLKSPPLPPKPTLATAKANR